MHMETPDDAQAATLTAVLAEIDPFLDAVNRRYTSSAVRLLVSLTFSYSYPDHGAIPPLSSLFAPGYTVEREESGYSYTSYSDVHKEPPPLHPHVYRHRSAHALSSLVKILISAGVDVDMKGGAHDRTTPLAEVVHTIYTIINTLKKRGTSASEVERARLVEKKAYMVMVAETLLRAGTGQPNVIATWLPQKFTLLHMACHEPSFGPPPILGPVVKLLLRVGADPSKRDMVGATPLHWAASVRSVDKVKLLLDAGADVHAMTKVDYTPLHFLFISNLASAPTPTVLQIARILIAAGASLNRAAPDSPTPFHVALRHGTPELVRELLRDSMGADIRARGDFEEVAVHCAAVSRFVGVMRAVLEAGGSGMEVGVGVEAKNELGETPLIIAAREGSVDMVQYLLSPDIGVGADPNAGSTKGVTPLYAAIDSKDSSADDIARKVGALLDAGAIPHPSEFDPQGSPRSKPRAQVPLLHYAVTHLRAGALLKLLAPGSSLVDVNERTTDGNESSVLHVVCSLQAFHQPHMEFDLVNSRSRALPPSHSRSPVSNSDSNPENSDAEPESESDPLLAVVRPLLAHGANPNARDAHGNTPLHTACAAVHVRHHDPRHVRAFEAHVVKFVGVLVGAGVDVNARSGERETGTSTGRGWTPLHVAARAGSEVLVRALVALGADPAIRDWEGGTLGHYIASSPRVFPGLAGMFLRRPSLDSVSSSKAIITTSKANSTFDIDSKIAIDPNARDAHGLTPLHWAARGSHAWANIRAFIRAGADPNARDSFSELDSAPGKEKEKGRGEGAGQGWTPLHYAARYGTPGIVRRLVKAGADPYVKDRSGRTPLAVGAFSGSYQGIKYLLEAGVDVADDTIEILREPLAINRDDKDNLIEELQRLMMFFTKDLSALPPVRRQLQTMLLTDLYDITKDYSLQKLSRYEIQRRQWFAQGGFGDVFRGTFLGRGDVVFKRLHSYDTGLNKKRALYEASLWGRLEHKNILPLLGISPFKGVFHLVSPFMKGGNAMDFVQRNPGANRLQLLLQAAQGLEYMHTRSPPIIHGDLKGDNILVSDDGIAYLSDFGLSRPLADVKPGEIFGSAGSLLASGASAGGMTTGGNFRYLSPELLLGEGSKSLASDVYSFGRVILEILTGQVPFADLTSDLEIITRIVESTHERPDPLVYEDVDDSMWALLLRCWSFDPAHRPHISEIVDYLAFVCASPRTGKSGSGNAGTPETGGSKWSFISQNNIRDERRVLEETGGADISEYQIEPQSAQSTGPAGGAAVGVRPHERHDHFFRKLWGKLKLWGEQERLRIAWR